MKKVLTISLFSFYILVSNGQSREFDSSTLLTYCKIKLIDQSVCKRDNTKEALFDAISSDIVRDWDGLLFLLHGDNSSIPSDCKRLLLQEALSDYSEYKKILIEEFVKIYGNNKTNGTSTIIEKVNSAIKHPIVDFFGFDSENGYYLDYLNVDPQSGGILWDILDVAEKYRDGKKGSLPDDFYFKISKKIHAYYYFENRIKEFIRLQKEIPSTFTENPGVVKNVNSYISFDLNMCPLGIRYSKSVNSFDIDTDSLCFMNNPSTWPDSAAFSQSSKILHGVAKEYGACHGLVYISRAFFYNVEFDCNGEKMNARGYLDLIDAIVDKKPSDIKLRFPGYCNLRELCVDYKEYFMDLSLRENANHTMTFDVITKYTRMTKSNQSSGELRSEVVKIDQALKRGEFPLILFRYHVVLVVGSKLDPITGNIIFTTYDPNNNFSLESDIIIERDLFHNYRMNPENYLTLVSHYFFE